MQQLTEYGRLWRVQTLRPDMPTQGPSNGATGYDPRLRKLQELLALLEQRNRHLY